MNKKIILCALIIITLIVSLLMCTVGIFGVSSLSKLKDKTDSYKAKQELVESKKQAYNEENQKLTLSLNNYNNAKTEYEAIVEKGSKEKENKTENYYNLDSIWSTSKKISKKQNVKLSLDCKTSSKVSDNKDYIYANLEYKVSGEYKPVIDFIVAFGSNGKFDLKISKFKLSDYEKQPGDVDEEVANYVQATFVVKNVPLSSSALEKK